MRRVLLVAVLAGCSFPDPTIEPAVSIDSGAPTDTSLGDAPPIDSAVGDGARDTNADVTMRDGDADGDSALDSGMRDADAGDAKVDTGTADTLDPCDKDKDGHKAAGGTCGGFDCDDNDSNANPGVTTHVTFNATGKSHSGDWNCDGTVERLHATNVTCPLTGGAACDATKGFQSNPICGTAANYVTCKTNGLGCEGTVTVVTQACK